VRAHKLQRRTLSIEAQRPTFRGISRWSHGPGKTHPDPPHIQGVDYRVAVGYTFWQAFTRRRLVPRTIEALFNLLPPYWARGKASGNTTTCRVTIHMLHKTTGDGLHACRPMLGPLNQRIFNIVGVWRAPTKIPNSPADPSIESRARVTRDLAAVTLCQPRFLSLSRVPGRLKTRRLRRFFPRRASSRNASPLPSLSARDFSFDFEMVLGARATTCTSGFQEHGKYYSGPPFLPLSQYHRFKTPKPLAATRRFALTPP